MHDNQLSKTDFMQYLNCAKSLWLLQNKPSEYPHGEFSDFARKLASEGYMLERCVQELVGTYPNADSYSFQQVFETEEGLYAKADMVLTNNDRSIDIFEVKSSTSVDDKQPHNQLKDAAFQSIAAMRCGKRIRSVFIVHLNKEYVRDGEIDPNRLLTFADETARVKALIPETEAEIANALAFLANDEIDESSCSCLNLAKANHCDSFDYFNPNIPNPSIYSLPRLSAKKRDVFVGEGRFHLDEIAIEELTPLQRPVLKSFQDKAPHINISDIESFMSLLRYPLYHLDYETYASAIPIIDGTSPHQQFPFQFSLHVQQETGEIEHHEFLATQPELPHRLIDKLVEVIGPVGSIVVWNKGFENSQNKNMAAAYPKRADFLLGLVSRTVDLMVIFKTGYVDIKFNGSTSIKKVLPVVVPDLSYDGMDVADGTAAMDTWRKMLDEHDEEKKDDLRNSLLEYCKLDTLAMVRIFQFVEYRVGRMRGKLPQT